MYREPLDEAFDGPAGSRRAPAEPARHEFTHWIRTTDPLEQEDLKAAANAVRRSVVGDAVHLRGLIEISNHCRCACRYCGLRRGRQDLQRYRMSGAEVLEAARRARILGCGTVVLQAGEDPGLTRPFVGDLVRRIQAETGLVVTLSLGARSREDLRAWRRAGADRYFMRFETSDPDLFAALHPASATAVGAPASAPSRSRCAKNLPARLQLLLTLRDMGYEIGSGFMVGLPGQGAERLARDLELCKDLDLDMIGIGPYVPPGREATPDDAGVRSPRTAERRPEATPDQILGTEAQVCRVIALARLVCPEANIPSTTALSTISTTGRQAGLAWGANVWMPNLTPEPYRGLYRIYPGKPAADVGHKELVAQICTTLDSMGRYPGTGPGSRRRSPLGVRAFSGEARSLSPIL